MTSRSTALSGYLYHPSFVSTGISAAPITISDLFSQDSPSKKGTNKTANTCRKRKGALLRGEGNGDSSPCYVSVFREIHFELKDSPGDVEREDQKGRTRLGTARLMCAVRCNRCCAKRSCVQNGWRTLWHINENRLQQMLTTFRAVKRKRPVFIKTSPPASLFPPGPIPSGAYFFWGMFTRNLSLALVNISLHSNELFFFLPFRSFNLIFSE